VNRKMLNPEMTVRTMVGTVWPGARPQHLVNPFEVFFEIWNVSAVAAQLAGADDMTKWDRTPGIAGQRLVEVEAGFDMVLEAVRTFRRQDLCSLHRTLDAGKRDATRTW